MRFIFRILFDFFKIRSSHALLKDGYLVDVGWHRSFTEKACVDQHGNPIPWIAYSAIDFIKTKIQPDMRVFEYGSGYSTLWWASKVAQVHSVEHDTKWLKKFSGKMPSNVTVYHEVEDAYFTKPTTTGVKYDIIILDGLDRIQCLSPALDSLTPDGVIIWDDSFREEYNIGFERLEREQFKRIFFTGLGPMINTFKETSIFYRAENCLSI